MELFAFLIAIIANSCFAIMAAQYKTLRNQAISARLVMAISGLTAPFWLTGLAVAVFYYGYVPKMEVLILVGLWVAFCIASTWLKIFLVRFQSLSELNALSKSLLFVTLMISDLVFFRSDIDYFVIAGAVILFAASMIFSRDRIVLDPDNIFKGPYIKMLGLVLLMCLIVSAQLIFYKKAVMFEDNTLFYVFLAASLLHTSRFFAAPIALPKKLFMKEGRFLKPVLIMTVMMLIGATLEAFAYRDLPLILVHMSAVIPAIVYAVFDYLNGEVRLTTRTKIAFAMTLAAISLVAVGKAYF